MKSVIVETTQFYAKFAGRKTLIIIFLSVMLIVLGLAATSVGAASVGMKEAFSVIVSKILPFSPPAYVTTLDETVIFTLRLPRVLMAIITGISLAGAGAVMQGILRNPLVSPYTLGLSSGAAFGAGLAIVLGVSLFGVGFLAFGKYLVVINAFIFGLLTMLLVYGIARLKGMAPETLILAGVAIGYLFSAMVSGLKYISDEGQLHEIVFWLMGGLWAADWKTVGLLFPISFGSLVLMIKYAWDLNALSAGDEVAVSLGIDVNRVRIICLVLASLVAASSIAFTGIIGFIGLVAPHISRIIIGSDHRFLIPCSCLMGAVLLLGSDTLARTVISPTEIPVGIITSLIGAPFFIYLLIKKRRRGWS